jgi:hypothetical protein
MPIVRAKMIDFVNSGGITIAGSKGLYIKNAPIVVQPKPSVPSSFDEDTLFHGMTPKERMQKKKELETQRKIEEANRAAKDAASNYQRA